MPDQSGEAGEPAQQLAAEGSKEFAFEALESLDALGRKGLAGEFAPRVTRLPETLTRDLVPAAGTVEGE
jgi:hypothetical protein